MSGPAAGAERDLLGGGDAERRAVRVSDGVELHYLRWCGGHSPPWAVVVFLHGIASHGGWFAETAADLDTQGVAVYAPDRRGSGRSGGPRGHLNRYERALDDVDEVLRLVSAEHPGTPVFLAASSWAAKLGVVYAGLRPGPLAGLLLLGPGLLPTVSLSRARQLAVVAGHLVAPTARVPIPLTPELYTTTPRYRDAIRADRLRLLTATTRFFWETARLDRRRRHAAAGLGLPLLLLQGEDDAMMDVAGTRDWFSRLGAEDKTYRAYPGAGHTLDFEPDRRRYLADMVGWLSDRVPSGPSRPAGGGP
ncbi:MAG TPA: alpha/beta fold hydrolase [Actinomycetota bacterium]|jgi:alpha-beta hydrolase superfamily lysophospholipase|nr:alpha/beta fold hydrolase [Actinomycetota bacterium]